MDETKLTYRRYKDGEAHRPAITDWPEHHVVSGESNKCPIYVHRTPPCQGSCPSGHDRGPSDFDHRPTMGTDYGKCIGYYICADVCPSGYIQMGLGG